MLYLLAYLSGFFTCVFVCGAIIHYHRKDHANFLAQMEKIEKVKIREPHLN